MLVPVERQRMATMERNHCLHACSTDAVVACIVQNSRRKGWVSGASAGMLRVAKYVVTM